MLYPSDQRRDLMATPSYLRRVATVVFAVSVSVPLLLPIRGFEAVPPLAQGVTLASVLFLAGQLGGDAASPRPGGGLRLTVYTFVVAALISFGAGAVIY